MKYVLVLMLVLGTAFAATLLNFDIDTENTCDGTDEITIVSVTDSSDSDPVEDAYVKVEDISPWKQKTSGLADSDGEFEFEGCGDTWNVSASYGGYATKTITVTLGACGSCTASTPPSTPPPVQNTTNTTSPPSTPPPTTSNDSNSTTTTSGSTTTGSTTTSTPPSYPADTSSDETNETEAEEDNSAKKKPLPCCASSAILIGLVGLLALKARR